MHTTFMMISPRCIVHLDADCFYAAVERKRINWPLDKPLAVQQWSSLIAVDYNARKYGVKRGMSAEESLKLCPSLQLVHVEVIGEKNASSVKEGILSEIDNTKQKVSLARYRKASFEMFKIFRRFLDDNDILYRASVDEAYLDITSSVSIQNLKGGKNDSKFSTVIGNLDTQNVWDLQLANASRFVHEIRKAVSDELGYTISAGIANNKMIAKIASSQNKPNKQTIIPRSEWQKMLAPLPIKSIPRLGGKFGREIEHYLRTRDPSLKKVAQITVKSLQRVNAEDLIRQFGEESGKWLNQIRNGEDNEPVTERVKPKSILAMKSFTPTSDAAYISMWLKILADEVCDRCVEDSMLFKRQPKALVLHHRGKRERDHLKKWLNGEANATPMCTIRCQLAGRISSKLLHSMALKLLRKVDKPYPCSRIGISVTEFVHIPVSSVPHYFKRIVDTKDAAIEENRKNSSDFNQLPETIRNYTIPKKSLTWEEVDRETLEELPQSLREEIEASMHHSVRLLGKKQKSHSRGQQSIQTFFEKS